jgi:hypothetical protein
MSAQTENSNNFQYSPYSLVEYLSDNKIYTKYASGDYDNFGILLQPFENILPGRFIRIGGIGLNKYQIDYVDEILQPEVIGLCEALNYDFNLFKELGYKIKSKQIKIMFVTIANPSNIESGEKQTEPNPVSFDDYVTNWVEKTNKIRGNKGMGPLDKDKLINYWKKIYKQD